MFDSDSEKAKSALFLVDYFFALEVIIKRQKRKLGRCAPTAVGLHFQLLFMKYGKDIRITDIPGKT